MSRLIPTPHTKLRRKPQRGSYELELIHTILDEGLICHVGFTVDERPRVLPMAYARRGESLYLHGAVSNHLLRVAASAAPLCVTVTLVDGLVLARSAFRHSMNYRCVVLFGAAREVLDPAEKRAALDAIVEHSVRGRASEARPPNDSELNATRVFAIPIQEASAKVRSGPPLDDPDDRAYAAWAGVIPLRVAPGAPIPVSESPADEQPSVCVRKRASDQAWPIREERREELLLTTDVARLDVDTIHRFLSERSYWAKGVQRDTVERALRASSCVGVLRPDASDELVGFARAVTDGATFVYLMDVFVLEGYRGRGIGKWLVAFLRALPELAPVRRWMLGTRDAHGLYEKFGFSGLAAAERWMEIVAPYTTDHP